MKAKIVNMTDGLRKAIETELKSRVSGDKIYTYMIRVRYRGIGFAISPCYGTVKVWEVYQQASSDCYEYFCKIYYNPFD